LKPTIWHWVSFCAAVAVLLALDLTVFHRKSHEPSLRESAWWTAFWCSLAALFNGLIWWMTDLHHAVQFLTGYIVEWSLSMDNVFVILVIFTFFNVPLKYQYRVLFWGILGAIVMRLTFILAAGVLIQKFDWMMPLFGLILVYTGIKLAVKEAGETDPEKNLIMRFARRFLRVSREYHGERFFVREGGKLCATPLFLVLLVIESTDVVFAVDSVPAIYGVTEPGHWQQFIIFTSNVFAILGLRALYFLLAGMVDLFRYLHYGLSVVLIFIGAEMLLVGEHAIYQLVPKEMLPIWGSLLVIVVVLGVSIVASIIAARRERPQDADSGPPVDRVK